MIGDWFPVERGLPEFGHEVLVWIERAPLGIHYTDGGRVPEPPPFPMVAVLRRQWRTGKPLWCQGWAGEQFEDECLVVTHWAEIIPPVGPDQEE